MKIPAFLMIGILALLCSCGGGGSSSNNPPVNPPPPVSSNPLPSITSLSPSTGTANGQGFTLTVNGKGFISGSAVMWNGAGLIVSFVSSNKLTAAVPATVMTAAGTVAVTVFNPAPGGGASNAATFTVNESSPAPQISSLRPAVVLAGRPGFTLTVRGHNFDSGSVVQWNGAARATIFVSAAQLQGQIPASDVASKGTAQVTVHTSASGGATSNTAQFRSTVFGGPVSFSVNPVSATWGSVGSMASGNFNSDGHPDFAIADIFPQNPMQLGFGAGNGGFSFAELYLPSLAPTALVAGDFNGDGIEDLAFITVSYRSIADVGVVLGDRKGTFKLAWSYKFPSSSCMLGINGSTLAIAATDVNGDSNTDLIVVGGGLSVFAGKGDGTFAAPAEFGCKAGSEYAGITAADFNNDGFDDLAVVDIGQNSLNVWLNDDTGRFTLGSSLSNGGQKFAGTIVSADLDLDGNIDIAAKANPNEIFYYFGKGDGTFAGPFGIVSTLMASTGYDRNALSAADVNGDGIPDLTVSGPADPNQFPEGTSVVQVYLSSGDRGFVVSDRAVIDGAAGGIAVFDADGNGKADILVGGESGMLWEMLSQ